MIKESAMMKSEYEERMPWNAEGEKINIIVKDFSATYNDISLEDVNHRCYGIILDTSTATKDEVIHNALLVRGDGNFKHPTAYFGRKIMELEKAKVANMTMGKDTEYVECFACSVFVDEDGEIDWATVGKSTIHPDSITKEDIDRVCENYDLAVETISRLYEEKGIVEQSLKESMRYEARKERIKKLGIEKKAYLPF